MNEESMILECIETGEEYPLDHPSPLSTSGGLLQLKRKIAPSIKLEELDQRLMSRNELDRSGVWRYREWILPLENHDYVVRGEGNTNLYRSDGLQEFCGIEDLRIKHEGENPTGSFKDRGMTAAATMAKKLGYQSVACASTGNTSASMASFGAAAGLKSIVFLPEGKIASGKLSQAVAYGAGIIQIQGSFDEALKKVRHYCKELGIYLMNSLNPYRIEGQKAILFELFQQLDWKLPDWIVLPGGNLGNVSALGKALLELKDWGYIKKLPRVAVIQAKGANPFYQMIQNGLKTLEPMEPETFATAIRIGNPISFEKARRVIESTRGVVRELTEEEIAEAKRAVDRTGIGAEPASCCSVGGLKKLIVEGVIDPEESAVCILTGHLLKDPEANLKVHERNTIMRTLPDDETQALSLLREVAGI